MKNAQVSCLNEIHFFHATRNVLLCILLYNALVLAQEKGPTTQHPRTIPLSYYNFLLGGSWVHTKEGGPTQGTFTEELFIRTRWYDSRRGDTIQGIRINSLEDIPKGEEVRTEKQFLDLLIDGQFHTNVPFNEAFSSTTGPSKNLDSLVVNAVSSSKLSIALFLGSHRLDFFDRAAVGPIVRFEISSQEKSADIFRRLVYGLRFENRSSGRISSSSIEVGFTQDQVVGSLQGGLTPFTNLHRIVLEMALPVLNDTSTLGLYVQFHGEWHVGGLSEQTPQLAPGSGEIAPPLYQFRVGATFDPINIVKTFFGF